MTDPAVLLPRLEKVLAERLAASSRESMEGLEIEESSRRDFASVAVLRLRTGRGCRRILAKTVVHHPVNREITEEENQAVVEYDILSLLHPRFAAVEGCSVPRPLAVLPDAETVVMDFVEGVPLTDEYAGARYLAPRRSFQLLRGHYRLVGIWLRHFKEFTGICAGGAEAMDSVIRRCFSRLEMIEEMRDPRWTPGSTGRVKERLLAWRRALSGREVLISGCHADFGSWNIIAGPEGVTVIDFLGYRRDPFPLDILKMMMNFEDEGKHPVYSPRRIEALKRSFLEGLGPLPAIPREVAAIVESLHRICSVMGCLSNPQKALHRKIGARRRLAANTSWLAHEEPRSLLWPGSVV